MEQHNPSTLLYLHGANGPDLSADYTWLGLAKRTATVTGMFRSLGHLADGRKLNDSRHMHNLHVFTGYTATGIYRQITHFYVIFSILQKFSM
jgi:hypothetical protein